MHSKDYWMHGSWHARNGCRWRCWREARGTFTVLWRKRHQKVSKSKCPRGKGLVQKGALHLIQSEASKTKLHSLVSWMRAEFLFVTSHLLTSATSLYLRTIQLNWWQLQVKASRTTPPSCVLWVHWLKNGLLAFKELNRSQETSSLVPVILGLVHRMCPPRMQACWLTMPLYLPESKTCLVH